MSTVGVVAGAGWLQIRHGERDASVPQVVQTRSRITSSSVARNWGIGPNSRPRKSRSSPVAMT
jgi:hypothetical protein